MNTIKSIGIILTVLLIAGCNPTKDKLIQQITDKEKVLYDDARPIPLKDKIKEMTDLYKKYADAYPKDSLAPVYLYKAANLSMNNGLDDDAIKIFDQIIENYDDFSQLPEAYFLKAFIYDNNMKNISKAREAYTDFLQKFPKNDLADDAKLSIDNLGKTPEQIVNEFELKRKQQQDSATAANENKK